MKTKNRMIAMLEIAIVLCSVFLVAIPAIAAEQTAQEASANTITTASEDDYVLGVYGNANEDDTIDMGDVVYTKLAIFGKKPKTELCDAKYDGRINVLDVIQTKLIILGREKEITVNIHTRPYWGSPDIIERPVTVSKPIERIISVPVHPFSVMRSIKVEKDKIVGVSGTIKVNNEYFPEISKAACIGKGRDYEAILNLHPDLVIVTTSSLEKYTEKLPGVTVVAFDIWRESTHVDEIRRLGYILDKEDEAEEFIDFYSGVMNTIKEKVDKIPEEDRPKVYFEETPYKTYTGEGAFSEHVPAAGGINIFGDLPGFMQDVDPEEVIKRNPEIILLWPIITSPTGSWYYSGTDINNLIDARNEIMNRSELAKVEAVKNGRVYTYIGDLGTARHFMGEAYLAKWFHPELFEDFDPHAIHQEYITRFQGLPDDFLDTHGVFVYPEEPM